MDRLTELAAQLSEDERSVLVAMAEGLIAGREKYGALNPDDPNRDWLREQWEEMRDACNYTGAQLVRLTRLRSRANYPYGVK